MRTGSPFKDKLKLELSLTLGTEAFPIPGGQVKHFALHLTSHGFSASVSFWTDLEKKDAALYTAFLKQDMARVRFSVAGVYDLPTQPPPPLLLQGLVRTREVLSEFRGTLKGSQRNTRLYSLEFADAAQVLWRQHRPIELHTQKKMKDVLDAHKVDPIALTCKWDALDAEQPLLFLGLGEDAPATSFYDFVMWYVHSRGGTWTYDSQKDNYLLSKDKPAAKKPQALDRRQVYEVETQLPDMPRHGARVLNTFAPSPTTALVEQPLAAKGLWQDVLLRTPLATEAEGRQALAKQHLAAPRTPRLWVSFNCFPTAAVHPGSAVKLDGELWPGAMAGKGETMRVRELFLEATPLEPESGDGLQDTEAGYEVALSSLLEPAADAVPALPPYREPQYPLYVEGLMYAAGGGEKDRLYFLVEDEKNSLLFWQVTVPLWNKKVSVPAQPGFFPGHFYFPPYKNSRVLLALYFDRAELHRFLDWGEGVRLPMEGQGDHLLLGKNKTSQTSLKHDYADNKPAWLIQRTSDKDVQTLLLGEGSLMLKTKEDPGSSNSTPTYDVSPKVEAAKGEMTSAVGGAVGGTTAAFNSAMGEINAGMHAASEETLAALKNARAELAGKVGEARSEISGAMSKFSEAGDKLGGAAAEAKAALQGLL